MKARIIKKLSKKINAILPKYYSDSWLDKYSPVMTEAYEQGSRVKNCLRIGGDCDEWGEATDDHNVYENFIMHVEPFAYPYPVYPDGHRWEGLPITYSGNNMKGKLAIEHARLIAVKEYIR